MIEAHTPQADQPVAADMKSGVVGRGARRAALLLAAVAVLAALAGGMSTDAKAMQFTWNPGPQGGIHPFLDARLNVTCKTVFNANGTKTWNISAWVYTYSYGLSSYTLDTRLAVSNSVGFAAVYGPYRTVFGTTWNLGSSTVRSSEPPRDVLVAAQFAAAANGGAKTTAAWEIGSHTSFYNGLQATWGSMQYCRLY